MQRIALALSASLAFLALVAQPAMANDRKKFDKLIAKYTITLDDDFKPKTACVCEGSGQPGYVLRTPSAGGLLGCAIPTFDADGNFTGVGGACTSYIVLGK